MMIYQWLYKPLILRKGFRAVKMFLLRLRYGLNQVDRTFYIEGAVEIFRDLKAGPYSHMGRGCYVCPGTSIGAYTMLAPGVSIVGGDHITDAPGVPMIFSGRPGLPETVIGKDCWIGTGAIILAGCTIGDGAVVAAGSVVTKDVTPFTIVGGMPATVIRQRFRQPGHKAVHQAMLSGPIIKGPLCSPQLLGNRVSEKASFSYSQCKNDL